VAGAANPATGVEIAPTRVLAAAVAALVAAAVQAVVVAALAAVRLFHSLSL